MFVICFNPPLLLGFNGASGRCVHFLRRASFPQVSPALAVNSWRHSGHLDVCWLRVGCREPGSCPPLSPEPSAPHRVGHPFGQLPLGVRAGRRGRLPVWNRVPCFE